MALDFTAINPRSQDWDGTVVPIPLQAHELIASVAAAQELRLPKTDVRLLGRCGL